MIIDGITIVDHRPVFTHSILFVYPSHPPISLIDDVKCCPYDSLVDYDEGAPPLVHMYQFYIRKLIDNIAMCVSYFLKK